MKTNQIEAGKETVSSILSFSSVALPIIVPSFQREYKWDENRVLDLFKHTDPDDLSFEFIGTMVFIRDSSGALEVVDGQQRILSLVVILCALRDFIDDVGKRFMDTGLPESNKWLKKCSDFSNSLQNDNIYKIDPVTDEEYSRIVFARPGFDAIRRRFLLNENPSEDELGIQFDTESKLFRKNYDSVIRLLNEKYSRFTNFQELEDMVRLLQARVKKLRELAINAIYISDSDYAMEVFETINAKGITLRIPDLIKNFVYKTVRNGQVEEVWKQISDNCGGKDAALERLIKYDWSPHYELAENDIYRSIRENVTNPEEYLQRLKKGSAIIKFLEISNVDSFTRANMGFDDNSGIKNDIIRIADNISLLNVKQHAKLIMALSFYAKNYLQINDTLRVFRLVEAFSVRSFITRARTSLVEKMYTNTSRKIYQTHRDSSLNNRQKSEKLREELFKNMVREMKKIVPDDEFLVAFSNFTRKESSRDKTITKYFFAMIEHKYARNESIIDYKNRKTTIEEVLPQSYVANWPDVTAEEIALIFSIGNSTVLQQTDNGSASNYPIEQKLEVYKSSKLHINKQLSDLIERDGISWNKQKIEERAEKIAYEAIDVWSLDPK